MQIEPFARGGQNFDAGSRGENLGQQLHPVQHMLTIIHHEQQMFLT
jgi:hypothetical protein